MFVFVRKNNDLVELKAHLIHMKQVPLVHNTVLILCDEGAGFVTMLVHMPCAEYRFEIYIYTDFFLNPFCICFNVGIRLCPYGDALH